MEQYYAQFTVWDSAADTVPGLWKFQGKVPKGGGESGKQYIWSFGNVI